MKKVFLSCAVVLLGIGAKAQVNGATAVASAPYTKLPVELNLLPVQLTDKAENQSYYVDYSAMNTDDGFVPSGTSFYSYWETNSDAPALDSLFVEVAIALKPYIGFTDYADLGGTYYEPDLSAPGGIMRIDSLFGYFTHSNNSGDTNEIIITLRNGVQYNFGGDMVEGPGNTVYWSDTISSDESLSPNGMANGNFQAPNGELTESGFLWQEAVGVSMPVTANSAGYVIDVVTANLGMGDSVNVVGFVKAEGNTPVEPYIWNTTGVRSETPTQIGLFYVSAGIWAKVTYTNTVSIENLETNGFTIHSFMPNPAGASTTIRYELKTPADVRFMVTDMAGRQVDMIKLNGQQSGTFNYELNTSAYSSGLYNVNMVVNGQTYSQKLNVVK